MKRCPKCEIVKERSCFTPNKSHSNGLATYCRACYAKIQKEWKKRNPKKVLALQRAYHAKHPESHRRGHLRLNYGMEMDEYDELVSSQKGRCASCKKKTKLVVDHISGTLLIRGLLCNHCNRGLGLFKHDPSILRAAANYLEKEIAFVGVRKKHKNGPPFKPAVR
jgi:Recombination endonuclease VII